MTAQQIQPVLKSTKTQGINHVLVPFSVQKQSILGFIQTEIAILEYNWDGYGASPIEEQVLNNSVFLIENLPDNCVHLLQKENILPNPNGTLSFEWSKKGNELFLEIGNNYATYYCKKGEIIKIINNKFILLNSLEFRQFVKDLKSCLI